MTEIFICRHCRGAIEHAYSKTSGIYRHINGLYAAATWCGSVSRLAEPLEPEEMGSGL